MGEGFQERVSEIQEVTEQKGFIPLGKYQPNGIKNSISAWEDRAVVVWHDISGRSC